MKKLILNAVYAPLKYFVKGDLTYIKKNAILVTSFSLGAIEALLFI